MMDLSIIIVNYNVKEFLKNLIDSIRKAMQNLSVEIIVVDNASTDGSVEEISVKYPDIKLIVNQRNVGFGSANNQAMEIAKGKYFLLINPDTIVREDTFTNLVKFCEENSNTGMVGCKVLNPDGSLQLACRRSFPGPWTSFTKVTGLSTLFPRSKLFARYNLTYLDENKISEVDAISGSFMFMKREVYDNIGGFDPKFFMYGEDLDLCFRTQQAGYKVYYVPTTEIIHYKGESTKRSNLDEMKVFYDAMHLFVQKHLSTFILVEWILRSAIIIRRFIAFLNLYKLPLISASVDFILFIIALIFAENVYHPERWLGIPGEVKPWVYVVPAALQLLISFFAGAYKKDSLSNLRITIALLVGLIFISSLTYFFKQFGYSRALILLSYSFSFLCFSSWRIFAKTVFKIGTLSERAKNNTLIIGKDKFDEQITRRLRSSFTKFFNIIGFISQDQKLVGQKIGSYPVVGSVDNIRKVIEVNKINKVIFLSNELSFNEVFSIISICQGSTVDFMVAGSSQDFLVGKSEVILLDDIPLLKLQYNISSSFIRVIKRLFDFTLCIPFLIIVYPYIFIANKISRRKTDFKLFILHIPEVLAGKKSFVGPKDSSYLGDLFLGKTGLTGLWYTEQVNHHDKEDIDKLNLFYAKNSNIWLDLEIIGKTLSKMFIKSER